MTEKPKVGDKVRWRSQAGGSATIKTGEVIYSGDPHIGAYVWQRALRAKMPEELRLAREQQLNFGTLNDGVVVRVRRGKRLVYYAPRLSYLELMPADAVHAV